MWLSFWRSRNRLSLDELRYLTDQLQKVLIVNEFNKDFVIEALRSIAELLTYGDQHDSSYFEFFMEKQVMGEFVRILNVSKTLSVSIQLLQTLSIMIQNLKSEHAIYYLFSNEHVNDLITYSFDFRNEELLSFYISFLRAISGKLNQSSISLLVKTQNDVVVSFPLYTEAIRFAFHEEGMVRTAVRAVTLNVYHVGFESVNRFVAGSPHSEYFKKLVSFFQKRCIDLNKLVLSNSTTQGADSKAVILAAVDEIEDNLYYFSDVISAGIPDIGRLIANHIMQLLILPLLLPSLQANLIQEMEITPSTSMFLLCCIMRIVKIKDLANTIAAALFFPVKAFNSLSKPKSNGHVNPSNCTAEEKRPYVHEVNMGNRAESGASGQNMAICSESFSEHVNVNLELSLREILLLFITSGDNAQALGSLTMLATLLQAKELDESVLDAHGVLPQRKQQKKLLLQALVGEDSGEEQLFSPAHGSSHCELDEYLQKLKEQYGISYALTGMRTNPHLHRYQVLDALVNLFRRTDISAETLWDGGWLLRQLFPYSKAEFKSHHLQSLKDSYSTCGHAVLQETKGSWPDLLIAVLCKEWKKCKKAIEGSFLKKEPKCILLPVQRLHITDIQTESSYSTGERMCELVKVFVLLHHLQCFAHGCTSPEHPPIQPTVDTPLEGHAKTAELDPSGPKPGTELKLVDALPCRIAFERGKERHFWFLAVSVRTSGWLLLAEELPLKKQHGIIRVAAPLAGCDPRIDSKHPRWIHLRIRPSSLPFVDTTKVFSPRRTKMKPLVDGKWTLAFRDEISCRSALLMILDEINLQNSEVESRLRPLFNLKFSDGYYTTSEQ